MKTFNVKIEPEAIQDIQDAIHWYNNQQDGLGGQFYSQVLDRIESLRQNPFYQIRYKNVRCVNLSDFPFMIHFTIEEVSRSIQIKAVFHTSRNPKIWDKRM